MNRERLLHLRDVVLPRIPTNEFNMQTWGTSRTDCGTVGCAFGHAAFDPEFRAQGLHAEGCLASTCEMAELNALSELHLDSEIDVYFQGATGFLAAQLFFDVHWRKASYIFSDSSYDESLHITPGDVINHINDVLEGRI